MPLPKLEMLQITLTRDPHYDIDIEEFNIPYRFFEPFTLRMARRVVEALSFKYPALKIVKIGLKWLLLLFNVLGGNFATTWRWVSDVMRPKMQLRIRIYLKI